MFEIIPAIDLLDGKVVRLKQGRYEAETVYSQAPLEFAKKWAGFGVPRIHVVDLDGARTGIPKNIVIIKTIAQSINVPIQVGGGIRNFDLIKQLLDAGVNRVILGTTAVNNPNTLEKYCAEYGDKIAVAIDSKEGRAATHGWAKLSHKTPLALAKEALKFGVRRFIYTDISRDGMLAGPNFDGIRNFILEVQAPVIASGGVTTKEDIEKLKDTGAEGCIIGKALYEGKIKLEDIL
ncbi:1-(5-phosphoribosyl)-5-[(5-phosphoribosylamino)methylideneamino]imidazole-4-carboxamide isomerase [Candidatus Saganbacteria bacterium]|nr:1-(5-phosphoribosyl)-5-[(5-phosphoribosylamino)methylideneamino]imidazole-4-carboxamide isomerase [Candidatus Saganbacteria bacterium]